MRSKKLEVLVPVVIEPPDQYCHPPFNGRHCIMHLCALHLDCLCVLVFVLKGVKNS